MRELLASMACDVEADLTMKEGRVAKESICLRKEWKYAMPTKGRKLREGEREK
jgi:hypothetical protein